MCSLIPSRTLLQCASHHFSPRHVSTLLSLPRRPPCLRRFSSAAPRGDRYVRFSSDPQSPLNYKKGDLGLKIGIAMVVVGTTYYVMHLEQVPETGRWRFMDTSPRFEAQLGEVTRTQFREQFRDQMLPPNHPITKHVRRVASRILSSSNLGTLSDERLTPVVPPIPNVDGDFWNPDANPGGLERPPAVDKEWDVVVVNNHKIVNASATPGIIIVYTGILPICRDEQGLAAVLAHEIGHVVARHTAERISSQKIFIGFAVLLQIIGLDFGFSDMLSNILLKLPNSRMHEHEADIIGLRLMSKACFDPKAAPDMFARMGELEKRSPLNLNFEFLGTHPASENRVKHLEGLLPEGYAILTANPECGAIQNQLQQFRQTLGAGDGDWVS